MQIPMALCGVGRWEPMGAVPEGRFCKLQDKYQVFQQTHGQQRKGLRGVGPYSGTCTVKTLQERQSEDNMSIVNTSPLTTSTISEPEVFQVPLFPWIC